MLLGHYDIVSSVAFYLFGIPWTLAIVQVFRDQLHLRFLKKTNNISWRLLYVVFFMLSVNQANCRNFEGIEYCAMEVNH